MAFCDDPLLEGGRMHEHDVGVAPSPEVEGLGGAERGHPYLDVGPALELRQQVLEEA